MRKGERKNEREADCSHILYGCITILRTVWQELLTTADTRQNNHTHTHTQSKSADNIEREEAIE